MMYLKVVIIISCSLLIGFIILGCSIFDRHPDYYLDLVINPKKPQDKKNVFMAGFGRAKITPKILENYSDLNKNHIYDNNEPFNDSNNNGEFDAIWLAGYGAGRRAATGVHDDLWAIASILDDGNTRIAIISLDVLGLPYDEVIEIRQTIPDKLKIDYTVICATHSHHAPDLIGLWGKTRDESGVNKNYLRFLKQQVLAAINIAVNRLQPSKISYGIIHNVLQKSVRDRRLPYVWNGNVNIMHFTNQNTGGSIGTIIGWAAHPVILRGTNTLISSDYVGYLRKGIEKGIRYKSNVIHAGIGGIPLFINGAIGGIDFAATQKIKDPFTNAIFTNPSFEKAQAVGYTLADKILTKVTSNLKTERSPLIGVYSKTIEVNVDNWSVRLAVLFNLIDRGFSDFFKIKTEIGLITIGDIQAILVPGEIYPEIIEGGVENPLGADYKIHPVEEPPLSSKASADITFVFGLANDQIGYIIPKSEWDKNPPWLYNHKEETYGEIYSIGPNTSPTLYEEYNKLFNLIKKN